MWFSTACKRAGPPVDPGRARTGSARSVTSSAPAFWNATQPTVRDCVADFETANRGAVSRRARNQIERKTIPNYYKLFNEFSL